MTRYISLTFSCSSWACAVVKCSAWADSGLAITTTYGTLYEPRNFNRQFAARCRKAGVR